MHPKTKNLYHYGDSKPNMAAIAASYAYGISANHSFIDGSKRTAYIVYQLFLALNRFTLTASPADKYQTFIALASGALSEAALAQWIKDYMATIS